MVNDEKLCAFCGSCFFVVLCKLKFYLGVPVYSVKMKGPKQLWFVVFTMYSDARGGRVVFQHRRAGNKKQNMERLI